MNDNDSVVVSESDDSDDKKTENDQVADKDKGRYANRHPRLKFPTSYL